VRSRGRPAAVQPRTVDDVAAVEVEAAEGGGGEVGSVTPVSDEDDAAVAVGQVGVAVLAVWAELEQADVD
jgi:hypothetical protein